MTSAAYQPAQATALGVMRFVVRHPQSTARCEAPNACALRDVGHITRYVEYDAVSEEGIIWYREINSEQRSTIAPCRFTGLQGLFGYLKNWLECQDLEPGWPASAFPDNADEEDTHENW